MKHLQKIIIVLALIFVPLSCMAFYGWLTPDTPVIVEKIVEKPTDPMDFSLYELANKEREEKMVWNPCLVEKAQERAKSIFKTGMFSHENSEGEKPFIPMIDSCYGEKGYMNAGENLTIFYSDPTIAHTALMNSPTHRQNILGDYTDMGVGCFENVCVEFFAK